jgi:hypothetical protein
MSLSRVVTQLRAAMGKGPADQLIAIVLREANVHEIRTPDDQLRFAHALMTHGGVAERIGSSLRSQSILWQARQEARKVSLTPPFGVRRITSEDD